MTAPKDDLEAVRLVTEALNGFDVEQQERIMRWAREKLGLPISASAGAREDSGTPRQVPLPTPAAGARSDQGANKDLRTFVGEKKPKSDVQFAATVAYFHRFEALQGQRKNEITSADLVDASRLVNRTRLRNPGQTLLNAHNLGLLDRVGRGSFTINSVGENLVAMTLPSDSGASGSVGPRNRNPNKKGDKIQVKTKKRRTSNE